MLWRAFSIISATAPLITLVAIVLTKIIKAKKKLDLEVILIFFFGLHCLNRFVLIGLVFYSFLSLPADVYKTVNWLNFVAFLQ